MEFEVVNQVQSRWTDGRTFSAMPGRRVTVDDADTDAVAHMRHLVTAGDAVEIKPKKAAKKEPETVAKIVKPPEPPPATGAAPTNEELRDDLRERGLPVSGNKDELIERLADDDADQAEAAKNPPAGKGDDE
jgi:alkanesulfonate monooxygenase SsuD/methylene tetrahydromethanopterin reductase-like flavin-dependent oxidoreductase (luciferase family)